MKNVFDVLPENFFKPLTSKYRRIYADCILLIYDTFRAEISYGVNQDVVRRCLMDYFDTDDDELTFDEEVFVRESRDKANGMILALRDAGWIEYEQQGDHQVNIALFDYTIPIIESMDKVLKEEETEYQGLISQIHAILQNDELYRKPYELILIGVNENTARLVSELKRLSVSIKRHIDEQTRDKDAAEIMELFLHYQQEIGSKAYFRLKTGDNISHFRNSILERLSYILETEIVMERAVAGYMEVESEADHEVAYEALVEMLNDIRSAFYRLDDILEEIDRKHTLYLKNAVMRAKFLLSTGNNLSGKIETILRYLSYEMDEDGLEFSLYPQNFLSPESLRAIPVRRERAEVEDISRTAVMSEEERLTYKEALREKNRRRFTRKNINAYVAELLKDKEKIAVDEISITEKRDLIRIIYIDIYSGNHANVYKINRSDKRVSIGEYELPYFEIVRR